MASALVWAEIDGIEIIDPDGWRGADGVVLATPITRADYEARRDASTIRPIGIIHETLAALQDAQAEGDRETWHVKADDALCRLLRGLGYGTIADAFEAVPKWYA